MARMRMLKPSFFQNEELADLPMGCRLLFQGLWCLADREGRLEDRPRRIKAEVLPYDDCDVNAYLDDLARCGFIQRYEAAGMKLIQVVKFRKHQTPHIKEAASMLPPTGEHGARTIQAPEENGASTPLTVAVMGNRNSNGDWVPEEGGEPPAAPAEEIPDVVLDRVNQTLTGQPGWNPTPTHLVKLREIAAARGIDLELEALKIADFMRKPKRKDTQCTFRFVANWLERNHPPPAPVHRNGSARASPQLSALQTLGADEAHLKRDWNAELGGG